jgi:predicted dehydrogenase
LLLSKFLAPNREPSYRIALAHFVDAVRDKRPVHPDLWDAYRCLAVIEAAEESARSKQAVIVPNLGDEDFTG